MTTLNIIQVSLQLFCSAILVFFIIDMQLRKEKSPKKITSMQILVKLLCLLLIVDSCAYIFRGNQTLLGKHMVRFSNFGVFTLEYALQIYFVRYLVELIEESGGKVSEWYLKIIHILAGLGALGLVLTQFTGLYYSFNASNEYVRSNGIMIGYAIHSLILVTEIWMVFQKRKWISKWNRIIVWSYFALIIVSNAVQILCYGISFMNIGMTLLGMIMLMKDSMERADASIRQMQELLEQEKRLEEMNRRILLSSVQPHFLFNTLNAIEGVILVDTDKAIEAIENISHFLRASLDILNSDTMIPISRELKILKDYLSLIEIRFFGDITMEIEQPKCEYLIPPFSLQPLAENAINHGIRKKKKGRGKLAVRCLEEEEWHVLQVIDDGVGFQLDEAMERSVNQKEEDIHMGIKIVRNRLKLMCDGELEIYSELGVGTTCEIRIPKKKKT